MIIVSNRIPVSKGFENQFEEFFRRRQRFVEKMPGFVRFELQRPIKGITYNSTIYWRSHEDFKVWTESPEFEKAHSRGGNPPPEGMFAGKNELEIHEVILSSADPQKEASHPHTGA